MDDEKVIVLFKELCGPIHKIPVSLGSKVKALKGDLATKSNEWNVEPERLQLVYSGRVLSDDEVLLDAGIRGKNLIHVFKSPLEQPSNLRSGSSDFEGTSNTPNTVNSATLSFLDSAVEALVGGFSDQQARRANSLGRPSNALLRMVQALGRNGQEMDRSFGESGTGAGSNPHFIENYVASLSTFASLLNRTSREGQTSDTQVAADSVNDRANNTREQQDQYSNSLRDSHARQREVLRIIRTHGILDSLESSPGISDISILRVPNNLEDAGNTRPEELYEEELAQLREMGFFDVNANIHALQITDGVLEAAINLLVGNPSLGM